MLAPDFAGVPYGPDPDHWLDVYLPAGRRGPVPAIVFLAGGGDEPGATSGATTAPGLFDPTAFGWAYVHVEYRRFPTHVWPTPNEDPRRAMYWLRQNGAGVGIDPTRLVLGGRSFGSYLTALALVHAAFRLAEPVKGWFGLQAMLDWTLLAGSFKSGHFGTASVGQVPAATLADASPQLHLDALPAGTPLPSAFTWYAQDAGTPPPFTNPHQAAYGSAWCDELTRRGVPHATHIVGPWNTLEFERWLAAIGA